MKLTETGNRKIFIILSTAFLLLTVAAGASAQELSLIAELEKEQIWLGDSVQLNLYLQGSEEAISPRLDIPGVRVDSLGGTTRSSRSVTNINGKVTETIRKAYVCGYSLTPESAGRIIIPPITVDVDGRKLSSRQLILNVRQPQLSKDFSLKLGFSRSRLYRSEECILKISFYYSASLRSLDINIPGIAAFEYAGVPATSADERYDINVNGKPVVFSRDDRAGVAGLSADIVFRPDEAGMISIRNATASFESVTGYQRVQDFFGRIQNQEVYGRNVVPGNTVSAEVLPFPEEGRPDDFFGLSGDIKLSMKAEPEQVHIGDPITLTLGISGMNNTDVDIPPLDGYLGTGIDIPDTRSSAKIDGRRKTVIQTVRIKEPAVAEIPAVGFSYFDTGTESYQRAATEAIPLEVLDTKIVTSAELEGEGSGADEDSRVRLEKKREGIYHNYSGKHLLKMQPLAVGRIKDSVLLRILMIMPPVVFLIVLLFTAVVPQLRARAAARADRGKAVRRLKKSVKKADPSDPAVFLRNFNRDLSEFYKVYGTVDGRGRLGDLQAELNGLLYGREPGDAENAKALAVSIIKLLEIKGGRNEE